MRTARGLFLLAWVCWLGVIGAQAADPVDAIRRGPNRLAGVFIQLDLEKANWPRERWDSCFREMEQLGIRSVIIQWCRHGDVLYYGRAGSGAAGTERGAVGVIFDVVRERGFELYLGLYDDPAYWTQIQGPDRALDGYLGVLRARSTEVASDLLGLVGEYKGFRGFYISQEVDDVTWTKPTRMRSLTEFARALSADLRRLRPGCEVLMSSFFRGRTSPALLGRLWSGLAAEGKLNAVLLQDGFGAAKTTAYELDRYAGAFRKALAPGGTQLWSVVEVFDASATEGGAFVGKGANLDRVEAQLSAAGPHADRLVAFSLEYLCPSSQTPGARALFEGYLRYLGGGTP